MKYQTGKVLWFNKNEGRGFILSEKNERIYVHYSAIQSKNKYKNKDQRVRFSLFKGIDFLQADTVKIDSPNSVKFIRRI